MLKANADNSTIELVIKALTSPKPTAPVPPTPQERMELLASALANRSESER